MFGAPSSACQDTKLNQMLDGEALPDKNLPTGHSCGGQSPVTSSGGRMCCMATGNNDTGTTDKTGKEEVKSRSAPRDTPKDTVQAGPGTSARTGAGLRGSAQLSHAGIRAGVYQARRRDA